MTDGKGAPAPGFQHLIDLDERLASHVRRRVRSAHELIASGADQRFSSRRWAKIAVETRHAYEIAIQGWACAQVRESGDG